MKLLLLLTITFAFTLNVQAQTKKVQGIVFLDNNNNSIFDKTDEPLPNISVSNLSTITQTNTIGQFQLENEVRDIVFVLKPSKFEFALKADNIPDFYRICYAKSSPSQLYYKGIENISKQADTLYFPMYKSEYSTSFDAQIIGDIQAPSKKEVEFFQQIIVPELHKHPANFKVCLGDIADNNLDIYPSITKAMQSIKTPLYMVFGNHDINYHSSNYSSEAETFKKHFGPDYYSFNYGNTHFVVLNTVLYKGWNNEKNKKGSYTGGVQEKQLNWLKQDLELVPNHHQIIVMAHIPLLQNSSDSTAIVQVFDLLKEKENITTIYGHEHATESWIHGKETLWNHPGKMIGQIAGAACGAWWVGPYGNDSIPDATCTDGTPPGIYHYRFSNSTYTKSFIAGGKDPDFQMRICNPSSRIHRDSLISEFIYVNVFDGNEETLVYSSLDNGAYVKLEKVLEIDPYIKRNQNRRFNRDNWTPDIAKSSHLWKSKFPNNLSFGKHTINAKCKLSNGKEYSSIHVFEIID